MSTPAPMPQQTELFTALFNPLLKRELAAELLDGVSLAHLEAMIEEGKLRAVSIGLGDELRHLRVWRWSIEAQRYPALARRIAAGGPPPLESLLPHRREYWWAMEVYRFLECSDQHVANLHKAGFLAGRRDGAQRLLRIERQSLLTFLTAREVNP